VSVRARSSAAARSRRAVSIRRSARANALVRFHAGKAARAAATAASTSAGPPRATLPALSSVAGSMTSSGAPLPSEKRPSIQSLRIIRLF
jgi:hypothetical protein